MDRKRVKFKNQYSPKWLVRQQSQRRYLFCIAIGFIVALCLSFYLSLILTRYWAKNGASSRNTSFRIEVSNYWMIRDDNDFTNKEFEQLMTSYLRSQHFNPVVPKPSFVDDPEFREVIEGKDDYLTTDDIYSNFVDDESVLNERNKKCHLAARNVLFLKTHYTGGDVITNILNRFADLRRLLVALPTDGLSSFYWPSRFHWRYMDLQRLEGSLPNVLCNHARYSADVMEKFMPFNTQFVSMLRNPVDYFVTVSSQLDIAKRMNLTHLQDPFETFAMNPKRFLKQAIQNKRFFDSMNLLKNGMFFDLGLHNFEYEDEIAISSAIFELKKKFTLILIYEYLDESLLLLKRKLCWKMDDILYLSSLLPRGTPTNIPAISPAAKEAISKWNMADFMLYDISNATLWEQIRNEKNFHTELSSFRRRRREVESRCKQAKIHEGKIYFDLVDFNETNKVEFRDICNKMAMTDSDYLEYFRKE